MLAYAAHQRSRRRLSPSTLALIVGGHAIAISLLAAAKMDVITILPKPPTKVIPIPLPPPPPQPQPQPKVESKTPLPPPPDSSIERVEPVLPLPPKGPAVELGPNLNSQGPEIGEALNTPLQPPQQLAPPMEKAPPVRVAARSVTPDELLRPDYPDSKRRSEEEAVLRLRLSIDQRGRVVAVDPVGTTDPAFLAAARSHLLRHWRYRPATEDGRPVPSTMVITLRFELEE